MPATSSGRDLSTEIESAMSLIAGFKINHVPVLIGDFLLSSKGPSYAKDQLGRSIFKNAIKKTVKLADNCVLAWCGDLLAAEPIYKDLYAHFCSGGRRFTKTALEDFLTTQYVYEEPTQLHADFIGWIVDEEPFCFRWKTDYPGELFYGESQTEGTGAKCLERVMNCSAEKHRDFAASGPRRGDFGPPSCQKLREIRDYSS